MITTFTKQLAIIPVQVFNKIIALYQAKINSSFINVLPWYLPQ
jgi:hypothetical protein